MVSKLFDVIRNMFSNLVQLKELTFLSGVRDRRHSFEKPIFSSLVQLAIAILYDLGLDKPPSEDPALILTYDLKGIGQPSRLSRSPTMEERRALLGCFLMSSVYGCVHLQPFPANGSRSTSFLQKGDTLSWTAYSNECLREIETQKEFASDVLLAHLVKLRLISERVINAPWTGAIIGDCSMRLPATFYLKSLEAQLRDFKSTISSAWADNSESSFHPVTWGINSLLKTSDAWSIGICLLISSNRDSADGTVSYRAWYP